MTADSGAWKEAFSDRKTVAMQESAGGRMLCGHHTGVFASSLGI